MEFVTGSQQLLEMGASLLILFSSIFLDLLNSFLIGLIICGSETNIQEGESDQDKSL